MDHSIAFRASILLSIAAAGILVACESSTTTTAENGAASASPAVDDGGDAANASDAGFGCCPLLDSPPTCQTLGLGGSKRFSNDACNSWPTSDAVYDFTVPGWKVTNDDGGCPMWAPPEGTGYVSCQTLPDASAH